MHILEVKNTIIKINLIDGFHRREDIEEVRFLNWRIGNRKHPHRNVSGKK